MLWLRLAVRHADEKYYKPSRSCATPAPNWEEISKADQVNTRWPARPMKDSAAGSR